MEKVSLVLVAGGKSSRMGTDKALLPFQGMAMYQYILAQAEGIADETIIITNNPHQYPPEPYPVFTDKIEGIGALGGILSALTYATHDICLVLACDMPFVIPEMLNYLLTTIQGYDAAIPQLGPKKFLEPFRAVYRKTCLPEVESVINSGQRKVISFLPPLNVNYLSDQQLKTFDPNMISFFNTNTPEELEQAKQLAQARNI